MPISPLANHYMWGTATELAILGYSWRHVLLHIRDEMNVWITQCGTNFYHKYCTFPAAAHGDPRDTNNMARFLRFYQINKIFFWMYWTSWHCERNQLHSIELCYGAKRHSFVRDTRFASIWKVKIHLFTSKQIFWMKYVWTLCGRSTCTQTQFRDIDASTRIKKNSSINFICDTNLLSSKWTFIQPDYHTEFFYLAFVSVFSVRRNIQCKSVEYRGVCHSIRIPSLRFLSHRWDEIADRKSWTSRIRWTNSTGAIQSGVYEGSAMWKGNLVSLFSE